MVGGGLVVGGGVFLVRRCVVLAGARAGGILGGNCPLAPASLGGPNFYFLAVRRPKTFDACHCSPIGGRYIACSYPRVNSCNKSENRSLAKFDECQPQVPMLEPFLWHNYHLDKSKLLNCLSHRVLWVDCWSEEYGWIEMRLLDRDRGVVTGL